MVFLKENVVYLTENITVIGPNKNKNVEARIDTGASRSSMDLELAAELRLGPIVKVRKIRSSHGKSSRPVVNGTIIIKNKILVCQFTLADRNDLKYPVLIGRNLLEKGNFVVDASNNENESSNN